MLPLLARFLNDSTQARGEVCLEEHKRFPLLLPINKLQGDSWVCFLESQAVSSPSTHFTVPHSWAGQQLQGPLQGILGADSPLRSERGKALSGMSGMPQRVFHSELLSPGQVNNKRNIAGNRPPIQQKKMQNLCQLKRVAMFISLTNTCSGRWEGLYSITQGDCTKIYSALTDPAWC